MPYLLQVKIDGVRMEIDEIEAVLAAAPGDDGCLQEFLASTASSGGSLYQSTQSMKLQGTLSCLPYRTLHVSCPQIVLHMHSRAQHFNPASNLHHCPPLCRCVSRSSCRPGVPLLRLQAACWVRGASYS